MERAEQTGSGSGAAGPREYDVVVVGGGPAGENAAGRCAAGGLSVAMVEVERVGGECSYWGCVPSKTLIRPGDVLAAARRVPGAAEAVTGPVNLAAALAQRDYMVNNLDDAGQLRWLAESGIDFLRGRARLARPCRLVVESGSDPVQVTARSAVVLATGTGPLIPPIPGLAEVAPWDNRDATGVRTLPERLLVLGGGAVGAEMAQAFRRLGGVEVTVLEGAPMLLAREEPFAGRQVQEAFEAEGITVHVGVAVTAARRDPDGSVVATLADGREVRGDEILVAVGRRPKTADLGLDSVGLPSGRYLDVDDQMRVRGVDGTWLYAVGDVNGRAPLTHMGKYQARIAGDVILGRPAADRADPGAVPRVTFTDPQVCAVGLTEAQAREQGRPVRVVATPTGGVAGAYTLGNGIAGTSQLVVDAERRVVIGSTFTGPGLQEMLHAATVAIVGEVPLDVLWHAVPSFPTVSEVWLRLLEAYGL